MIKAEIKKNNTVYVLDLTAYGDIHTAYAFALAVAVNKENYNDGVQILDLGTSQVYEHIRVYVEVEESPVMVAEPAAVESLPEEYIMSFEDRITYLGIDLRVKGIKAVSEGVPLVLVYEINDQPSQVKLRGEGLEELTYYVGQVVGYADPVVILPAGDLLTEEDALEYVEDYVKELRKAAQEKLPTNHTAKAFYGFTKDEE